MREKARRAISGACCPGAFFKSPASSSPHKLPVLPARRQTAGDRVGACSCWHTHSRHIFRAETSLYMTGYTTPDLRQPCRQRTDPRGIPLQSIGASSLGLPYHWWTTVPRIPTAVPLTCIKTVTACGRTISWHPLCDMLSPSCEILCLPNVLSLVGIATRSM